MSYPIWYFKIPTSTKRLVFYTFLPNFITIIKVAKKSTSVTMWYTRRYDRYEVGFSQIMNWWLLYWQPSWIYYYVIPPWPFEWFQWMHWPLKPMTRHQNHHARLYMKEVIADNIKWRPFWTPSWISKTLKGDQRSPSRFWKRTPSSIQINQTKNYTKCPGSTMVLPDYTCYVQGRPFWKIGWFYKSCRLL